MHQSTKQRHADINDECKRKENVQGLCQSKCFTSFFTSAYQIFGHRNSQ